MNGMNWMDSLVDGRSRYSGSSYEIMQAFLIYFFCVKKTTADGANDQ